MFAFLRFLQLDNGGYPGQLENVGAGGGNGSSGGDGCLGVLARLLLAEAGCAVALGIALCALILFGVVFTIFVG